MAFKINDSQQYSLTDSLNNLTSREMKVIEKSWAKVFAEDVFPAINEEPFRVLYFSKTQCRSNTPVNICVGALIIKEMFQNSDDDIVENLMLDTRYQYALYTTSYEEQPLSDKTLSRFRERCYIICNVFVTFCVNLMRTGTLKVQVRHRRTCCGMSALLTYFICASLQSAGGIQPEIEDSH